MEGDSQVVEAWKDPKSLKIQFSRLNYISNYLVQHTLPQKTSSYSNNLSRPRWTSGVSALIVI